MGGDSGCQPPAWLTRDFIAIALKEEYGGKPVSVTAMTVEDANRTQRGYMSRMYRVVAAVEAAGAAEPRTWHLIVKCALESGPLLESSRLQDMFAREALVLTSVLPAVHEVLGRLGEAAVGPRCLLAAGPPRDALVLGDLRAAGFGDPAPGFLDLPHCRLALLRLARLHAASRALAHLSGGEPPTLLRHDPFWQPRVADRLRPYHALQFRAVAAALASFPDCRRYSQLYQATCDGWVDRIVQAIERSRTLSDFKVLVHADVWNKNIMFKYRDGKPIDLRFVDFQVSHLATPARDLVFFLYGKASEEVLREHLDALLREYQGALAAALRGLGLPDTYTLSRLRADMRALAPLALFCACYAPVYTADDRRNLDIVAGFGLGRSGPDGEALTEIYRDPTLVSYWRFINPVLETMGAL